MPNLVNETADNFDLEAAFDEGVEDVDLENHPQFGESDVSYLTRLEHTRSAVTKPVDGHLVFKSDTNGKSVTGVQLPTKYIDAADVSNYFCSFKETESDGGSGTVSADWYDAKKAQYVTVSVGSGDPVTQLKECFRSESDALAAANAALKRTAKSNTTFNFSIEGRSDLFAEGLLVLRGFPLKIPGKWIISKVEHSLDSSGFHSSIECCHA